jgi:hypothetical protein
MKIWINRAGQNLGTYTLEEVQRGLDQGQFVATDLAWQEGMPSWKPLSEFPGVRIPAVPAEQPASYPAPAPPPAEAVTTEVVRPDVMPAWERRPQVKLFPAFFMTIRDVLFEPHHTFPRMPVDGRLGPPTMFVLMLQLTAGLISTIVSVMLEFPSLTQTWARSEELRNITLPVWLIVIAFPFVYVLSVGISLGFNFLVAGIHHLVLMLLGGANKGYDATYKVICYSYSAQVFNLIWCAPAALVFYFIASIIGLSKVHGTEGWKAAVAMLAPVILCCLLVVGGLIGVSMIAAGHGQQS